jgi:hypothetical protein
MRKINEYLGKLGFQGTDKVTGMSGVVTSVGFDLYGCVQVILQQPVDKEGKPRDSHWFDFHRIQFTSTSPVMAHPFLDGAVQSDKGPAEKPAFPKTPVK